MWKEKLKCSERGWDTWQCLKKRKRVWFLCLFFSFSLPLSLFIDLWEEIYRITHKNKCSQACISSPHNCITYILWGGNYVICSSAKAMLNDSNCWQCTVMEAFRDLTSNSSITTKLGFQKFQQSGIYGLRKRKHTTKLLFCI